MARQTRQQRRERRAQQQPEPALAGGPPAPPRPRPTAAGGSEPHREPRREAGGIPGLRFIRESWGELKKVEWPSQRQVITGTTVVLIACAVVGSYLYLNDIIWKHVVQNFLVK
jgi:preprotein translocase subunit SecE